MPEQKALPFVSVNIPAYNEEKFIGACLESLTNQTYPSYEVIVVDDGSTDKTVSIIQQFVDKDPRFKLVHQNHGGEAVARNCAAQSSKGEILCFLDADLAFAPDFVEKLIAPVLEGTAIGTFSREEYVKNYDNPWARSWNMNDGMLTAKRHPDDFPYEDTTFRAMRKSTFDSVGGFSSKGSGDDKTLSSKLGQKAKAAPGAICYHFNPDSPGEIFEQARWYARGVRVESSLGNFVQHTPPFSIARSIKRAIRHNNLNFIAFKLVYDFGIVSGMTDKFIDRVTGQSRIGR
jgi:glycosyltransferase involved in cell wall biosynthesis